MQDLSWRIVGSADLDDRVEGVLHAPEEGRRGVTLIAPGAVEVSSSMLGPVTHGHPQAVAAALQTGCALKDVGVQETSSGLLVRLPPGGWPVQMTAQGDLPVTTKYADSVTVRGWRSELRAHWTGRRDCRLDWRRVDGGRMVIEGVAQRRQLVHVEGVRTLEVEPAAGRAVGIIVEGTASELSRLRITLTETELHIGGGDHVAARVRLRVPRSSDLDLVDVRSVTVGDTHNRVAVHNTRTRQWVLGDVAHVTGYTEAGLRIGSVSEALRLIARDAQVTVGRASRARLVRAVVHECSFEFSGETDHLELLAVGTQPASVTTVRRSAVVRAIAGADVRFGGPATDRVAVFADNEASIVHGGQRRPQSSADLLRVRDGGRIGAVWQADHVPIEYPGTDARGQGAAWYMLDTSGWRLDRPLDDQGVLSPTFFGDPEAAEARDDEDPWTTLDLPARLLAIDASGADRLSPAGARTSLVRKSSGTIADPELLLEGPVVDWGDDDVLVAHVRGGPGICVAFRDSAVLPVAWRSHPDVEPRNVMLPVERIEAAFTMLSAAARARDARPVMGVHRASAAEQVATQRCAAALLDHRNVPAASLQSLVEYFDPMAWAASGIEPTRAADPYAIHRTLMVAVDRWLAYGGRAEAPAPVDWDDLVGGAEGPLTVDTAGAVSLVTARAKLRLDTPVGGVASGEFESEIARRVVRKRIALRTDHAYTLAALLLVEDALADLGQPGTSAATDALSRWPDSRLSEVQPALAAAMHGALRGAWRRPWRLSAERRAVHERLRWLLSVSGRLPRDERREGEGAESCMTTWSRIE